MFKLEKELRPLVTAWLEAHEMHAIDEFCMDCSIVDLVGVKFGPRPTRRIPTIERFIAVELKLHDVATVVHQAFGNRYYVHETFAAMPAERIERMKPGTLDKFSDRGIGLLAVSREVEVVLPPACQAPPICEEEGERDWMRRYVDKLHKRLWRRLSYCHPITT